MMKRTMTQSQMMLDKKGNCLSDNFKQNDDDAREAYTRPTMNVGSVHGPNIAEIIIKLASAGTIADGSFEAMYLNAIVMLIVYYDGTDWELQTDINPKAKELVKCGVKINTPIAMNHLLDHFLPNMHQVDSRSFVIMETVLQEYNQVWYSNFTQGNWYTEIITSEKQLLRNDWNAYNLRPGTRTMLITSKTLSRCMSKPTKK